MLFGLLGSGDRGKKTGGASLGYESLLGPVGNSCPGGGESTTKLLREGEESRGAMSKGKGMTCIEDVFAFAERSSTQNVSSHDGNDNQEDMMTMIPSRQ